MASMRGGQKVWNGAGALAGVADGSAVAQNSVSSWAVAGPGPYVCVYLSASQVGTYEVEVAAPTTPEAGLNPLDSTVVGGGLVWYTLSGHSGLAVAANTPIAFDLSPFAPPYIRLKRTDGGTVAIVNAVISCFGPN